MVRELEERFPDPAAIEKRRTEGLRQTVRRVLRVENVLQNYDVCQLKALQSVDLTDPAAVEAFKAKHYLNVKLTAPKRSSSRRAENSGLPLDLQRRT